MAPKSIDVLIDDKFFIRLHLPPVQECFQPQLLQRNRICKISHQGVSLEIQVGPSGMRSGAVGPGMLLGSLMSADFLPLNEMAEKLHP